MKESKENIEGWPYIASLQSGLQEHYVPSDSDVIPGRSQGRENIILEQLL